MEIVQQPPNGARAARHPARSRGASGAPGPMMPNDLPPREASYQQAQRRLKAGVVEAIVDDLHMTLPWAAGCQGHPTTQEWVSRREFPSAMRCRPFGYTVPFCVGLARALFDAEGPLHAEHVVPGRSPWLLDPTADQVRPPMH